VQNPEILVPTCLHLNLCLESALCFNGLLKNNYTCRYKEFITFADHSCLILDVLTDIGYVHLYFTLASGNCIPFNTIQVL